MTAYRGEREKKKRKEKEKEKEKEKAKNSDDLSHPKELFSLPGPPP